MKRYFSILLFAILFVSCRRYEDGPAISLLPIKARLSNTWKVEKYLRNGVDETNNFNLLYPDYTISIDNTEVYEIHYSNAPYPYLFPGTWKFTDSRKRFIRMTPEDSTADPFTYEILRLKNKALWITYQDASLQPVEIHYIPND